MYFCFLHGSYGDNGQSLKWSFFIPWMHSCQLIVDYLLPLKAVGEVIVFDSKVKLVWHYFKIMFKNKLKIFPSHQQHFDSNLHLIYSKCEDNKLMTFSDLIWHVDLCSGLETSVIGCRCECWSAGGLVCMWCESHDLLLCAQAVRDAEREKELKQRHMAVQREMPRPSEVSHHHPLPFWTAFTRQWSSLIK